MTTTTRSEERGCVSAAKPPGNTNRTLARWGFEATARVLINQLLGCDVGDWLAEAWNWLQR